MTYYCQAALFIAMKYEEIYPPDPSDWTTHVQEVINA